MEKKTVDWNAIKNAYISDPETSFRSLSSDYGISVSAIHKRAKEGKWAEKRVQFDNKRETLTLEKLAAERAKGEARRLKTLYTATDKLTKKVLTAIEKADPKNTLAIRQLTSSLRELLAIEGVQAPERDGEADNGGVVIMPAVEDTLTPPIIEPVEEAKDE